MITALWIMCIALYAMLLATFKLWQENVERLEGEVEVYKDLLAMSEEEKLRVRADVEKAYGGFIDECLDQNMVLAKKLNERSKNENR